MADRDAAANYARGAQLFKLARIPGRHATCDLAYPSEWSKAFEKAMAMIDDGGIVALVGTPGTGKTQLAVECMRRVCFAGRKACRYVRFAEFFMHLRECYGLAAHATERDVIREYAMPALLAIDELSQRSQSESETRALNFLLDSRYGETRATIIIANGTAETLRQNIGELIFDRLAETGGYIVCDWPSFRAKGQHHAETTTDPRRLEAAGPRRPG